jgi:hypothetical protein
VGEKKAPLYVCVAASHLNEQNWEKQLLSVCLSVCLSVSLSFAETQMEKNKLPFSLSSSIHTHTHTHTHTTTTKDNKFLPFFSSFLALVRDKPTILLPHVIQESNTILMIL